MTTIVLLVLIGQTPTDEPAPTEPSTDESTLVEELPSPAGEEGLEEDLEEDLDDVGMPKPPPPPPPAEPPPEPAKPAPVTPTEERPNKPAEDGRLLVLVLPLRAERVEEGLARTLDGLLASEVQKRDNFDVTTVDDLNSLMQAEKIKDLIGCEDASCASEIGGAVGAQRILSGSLGHIGGQLTLTLRWLDAEDGRSLGTVTRVVTKEANLTNATRSALSELLEGVVIEDESSRKRKRKSEPTFWTFEGSLGTGLLNTPESYDFAINGTLRLAWGGRPGSVNVYLYLLGGIGVAYFSGSLSGPNGELEYNRTQVTPYAELRLALPIANGDRTRLFIGGGAGMTLEPYSATQSQGLTPAGTNIFPELYGAVGGWHRLSAAVSLWLGYRFRMQLRGESNDSISELVAIGSTRSEISVHMFEAGWAWHF